MDTWLDSKVKKLDDRDKAQADDKPPSKSTSTEHNNNLEDDFFDSIIAHAVGSASAKKAKPKAELDSVVHEQNKSYIYSTSKSSVSVLPQASLSEAPQLETDKSERRPIRNDSVSSFSFEPLSETDDEETEAFTKAPRRLSSKQATLPAAIAAEQDVAAAKKLDSTPARAVTPLESSTKNLAETLYAENKRLSRKLEAAVEENAVLLRRLDAERETLFSEARENLRNVEQRHLDELGANTRKIEQRHQLELAELKRHYALEIGNSVKQTMVQLQQTNSKEVERLLIDLERERSRVLQLEALGSNSLVAPLEFEVASLKSVVAQRENTIAGMQKEVDALKKALDSEKGSGALKRDAYEREQARMISTLEGALADKEELKKELSAERAMAAETRDAWKQEHFEMQRRFNEDRLRLTAAEEALKAKLVDMQREQEALRSEVKAERASLAAERAIVEQHKNEALEKLESTHDQSLALASERTNLEFIRAELLAERRKMQETRASFEQRLRHMTEDYTACSQQLSSAQIELNQLKQEQHISKQTKRNLDAEWEAIEGARAELVKERLELHNLRLYLDDKKKSLWELQQKNLQSAAQSYIKLTASSASQTSQGEEKDPTTTLIPKQEEWLQNFDLEKFRDEVDSMANCTEIKRSARPRSRSVDLDLERHYQELEVDLIARRMDEYISNLELDRQIFDKQLEYLTTRVQKGCAKTGIY